VSFPNEQRKGPFPPRLTTVFQNGPFPISGFSPPPPPLVSKRNRDEMAWFHHRSRKLRTRSGFAHDHHGDPRKFTKTPKQNSRERTVLSLFAGIDCLETARRCFWAEDAEFNVVQSVGAKCRTCTVSCIEDSTSTGSVAGKTTKGRTSHFHVSECFSSK
jgi:hypothetical protein